MKAKHLHTYNGSFIVVVDSDTITTVPLDPANTDYQRIMELVDSGQLVIDPAE